MPEEATQQNSGLSMKSEEDPYAERWTIRFLDTAASSTSGMRCCDDPENMCINCMPEKLQLDHTLHGTGG